VALNVTVLHYEYTTRRDDRLYHHHRNMKDTSKPDLYNQYYMHNLPPYGAAQDAWLPPSVEGAHARGPSR